MGRAKSLLVAVLVLFALAGVWAALRKPKKASTQPKPSTGGACVQVVSTCNDGTTQPTPCDCASHGGVKPVSKLTDLPKGVTVDDPYVIDNNLVTAIGGGSPATVGLALNELINRVKPPVQVDPVLKIATGGIAGSVGQIIATKPTILERPDRDFRADR